MLERLRAEPDDLEFLDLSGKGLVTVPYEVFRFTNLKVCVCVEHSTFPRRGILPDPQSADASCHPSCELLSEYAHLLPHQGLYLSDNSLAKIPSDLFRNLPALEYLDLRNNRIEQLPDTIGCASPCSRQ